jgi:hypothetical protein
MIQYFNILSFKTTATLELDLLSYFLIWAIRRGVALNYTFQLYCSHFTS